MVPLRVLIVVEKKGPHIHGFLSSVYVYTLKLSRVHCVAQREGRRTKKQMSNGADEGDRCITQKGHRREELGAPLYYVF